ncbi:MAG: cupredoxin domain-containing protein [Solirubrobacterales bacterium]
MRLNRQFAALLAIGAAVAVPMVGCGGGSDDNSTGNAATQASTTGGAAATGAGGTVNLTATDFKFNPSDQTVSSGDVTFNEKNDGQVTHSLEIEDVTPGHDQELEGDVSPGQSGTLKANLAPGKYEFYCPIGNHKEMGMEGEITVK